MVSLAYEEVFKAKQALIYVFAVSPLVNIWSENQVQPLYFFFVKLFICPM